MTSPAVAFARRIHPGSDAKVTFAAFTPKERPEVNGKPPPALVPSKDFWHGPLADDKGIDDWITTTNANLNIYLSLGITVDGWELKKGQPKKDDILGARWVWVDQDVDKKKDLDEERARILDQFKTGLGALAVPSIIMDSGRGYWALWELDQVYPTKVIEEINRGLCAHFGADTAVADVGHVVRVPGTMNIRGGIWRPASIVTENGMKHKASAFPTIEKAATVAVSITIGTPQSVTMADDLDALVTRKAIGWEQDLARAKSIMKGDTDPESKSHDSFNFGAVCYRLGIKDDVTYGILNDMEWAAGDHCRQQAGRPTEAQALKDMEAAHEAVGPLDVPEAPKALPEVSLRSLGDRPAIIPAREWIIPNFLMRGITSILFGKGGDGKSLIALHIAVAVALNMRFAYWTPTQSCKTLVINFEDDLNEHHRRIEAICNVMDISPDMLHDKLFLLEASSMVLAAKDEKGKISETALYRALQKAVTDAGIEFIVVDPFIETHVGLDENSNTEMKEVIVLLRKLARAANIPLLLIHHSRKGNGTGDQDSARGGGAIVNAARHVTSVERMTEQAHLDIGPERPKEFYIRVVDAKSNYAQRADDRWLEIEVVLLGNEIDEAPALRKKVFDTAAKGMDPKTWVYREVLIGLVRNGREGGWPWKVAANSKHGLIAALKAETGLAQKDVKAAIEAFSKAGFIGIEEKLDEHNHRRAAWVLVNAQGEAPF